jgi:hypothetical protein
VIERPERRGLPLWGREDYFPRRKVMSIVCSDTGKPYVVPAVFEIELQERIEYWEAEVFWAQYHLREAKNFAEQIRDKNKAQ